MADPRVTGSRYRQRNTLAWSYLRPTTQPQPNPFGDPRYSGIPLPYNPRWMFAPSTTEPIYGDTSSAASVATSSPPSDTDRSYGGSVDDRADETTAVTSDVIPSIEIDATTDTAAPALVRQLTPTPATGNALPDVSHADTAVAMRPMETTDDAVAAPAVASSVCDDTHRPVGARLDDLATLAAEMRGVADILYVNEAVEHGIASDAGAITASIAAAAPTTSSGATTTTSATDTATTPSLPALTSTSTSTTDSKYPLHPPVAPASHTLPDATSHSDSGSAVTPNPTSHSDSGSVLQMSETADWDARREKARAIVRDAKAAAAGQEHTANAIEGLASDAQQHLAAAVVTPNPHSDSGSAVPPNPTLRSAKNDDDNEDDDNHDWAPLPLSNATGGGTTLAAAAASNSSATTTTPVASKQNGKQAEPERPHKPSVTSVPSSVPSSGVPLPAIGHFCYPAEQPLSRSSRLLQDRSLATTASFAPVTVMVISATAFLLGWLLRSFSIGDSDSDS